MKKTISILANLILVACVALLVAVLVAPSLLGVSLDTVLSGSMEPAIQTGALIAIEKTMAEDIQVGDIIGFKLEGMDTPVCHRVVEIVDTEEGLGFITKGDANEDPDAGVVKPENLIGRVVFDLSGIGYVTRFIKTPYGFGLLLGLPAIAIIAAEIRNIFWPKRTRRKLPRFRERPSQLLAYLPIMVGLVLIGVLWGIMAGQTQEKTLASLAERSKEVGQPLYTSQRVMQNGGTLPLVICLFSEDETVSFSESYFRLSSGEQKEIEISGDSETAVIRTGCFFPLLPQVTLYQLFTWNSRLAPLLVAAAWILPITIVTFVVLKTFTSKPRIARRAKYMKEMLSCG